MKRGIGITLLQSILLVLGSSGAFAQSYLVQRTNGTGNWLVRIQNNGTFFNRSVTQLLPGGFWLDPTGYVDTLIFGGGLWIGADRRVNGALVPAVSFSYEPSAGVDLFVPGSTINDGALADTSPTAEAKYGVYRSDDLVGPPWPVRMTSFGPEYIDDVSQRDSAGPPFVLGDEDMFTIYKDSDTTLYQSPTTSRTVGVEVRSQISFWKRAEGRDVIVVKNAIIHTSDDTLFDPVVALALDGDINFPDNDRLKGVQNEGVHAAVFFTDTSRTDPFLGVVLLAGQHNSRRLDAGMTSLLYWDRTVDPRTDSSRLAFLSTSRFDTATSKVGDARLLMASASTEPLIGKDTLYFDYALFALASEGRAALDPLDSIRLLKFATEITSEYATNRLHNLSVIASAAQPRAVEFYPNPGFGEIHFKGAGVSNNFRLFDAIGQEIHSSQSQSAHGNVSLDLRSLPSGIYFIRFEGDSKIYSFEHIR